MITLTLSTTSNLTLLFVVRLSKLIYSNTFLENLKLTSDVRLDKNGFAFKGTHVSNSKNQQLMGEGFYELPKSLEFSFEGSEMDFAMNSGSLSMKKITSQVLMSNETLEVSLKTGIGNYRKADEQVEFSSDFSGLLSRRSRSFCSRFFSTMTILSKANGRFG